MRSDFKLAAWGRVYNPQSWFHNPSYLVNRIYYIYSGTAYYMDNIRLLPGHLYLFGPDSSFTVRQDDSDPVDHVYFDFISYSGVVKEHFQEVDVDKEPVLLSLIQTAGLSFSVPDPKWHIAESYFDIIYECLHPKYFADAVYSFVTTCALREIHRAPLPELGVNAIAEKINVNVSYMIRQFKKEMGITPHRYISHYKVDIAIASLSEGQSAEEIAAALGFSSASAFSTFFKKTTRRPLAAFRK